VYLKVNDHVLANGDFLFNDFERTACSLYLKTWFQSWAGEVCVNYWKRIFVEVHFGQYTLIAACMVIIPEAGNPGFLVKLKTNMGPSLYISTMCYS
jgi:hypothetical protein